MALLPGVNAPAPQSFGDKIQAAMMNPLFGLGLGMLGGNVGRSSGAAFANALRGGMGGMQAVQQMQMMQAENQARQEAMQRQAEQEALEQQQREQMQQAGMAMLPEGLSPEEQAYFGAMQDPYAGFLAAQPKAKEPIKVGDALLDPITYEPLYEGRQEPLVQIQQGGGIQETERQKAYGKQTGSYYGQRFSEIQKAAGESVKQDARLSRLDKLLDKAGTGATSKFTQPIKRYAKDLGVNLEALGITDDVSDVEAANALTNEIALSMREEGTGAMSDSDREFFVEMSPGYLQTKEGRKKMIETSKKLNERARLKAKAAKQYERQVGIVDAGFEQEWADYVEKNPLFTAEDKAAASGVGEEATEAAGEVIDFVEW